MAGRLIRHACSRAIAVDKVSRAPWSSAVVAPITIAKLLQQWTATDHANHDHLVEIHPGQDNTVNGTHCRRGGHDELRTYDDFHGQTVGGNALEQRPPVFHCKHAPFYGSSRYDSKHTFEGNFLLSGRQMCHAHQLQFGSTIAALGPLGMAYACASGSPPPQAGSTRAYARKSEGLGGGVDSLFTKLPGTDPDKTLAGEDKLKKVTVVGVGNVGMACAQTILTDNLTDAIALVDVDPDKLRGEMLDLQHAAAYMPRVSIMADVDYKITANSDVCIITAGARQREGEDRLSLVDRNVQVFKTIIPKLVKYSPDTIFLVISNPVDILTWVTWKLSGFPPNRVMGSGTNLDSSRFRTLLANHFKVSAHNVHAHILGEHGDTCVPIWSSALVAGVPVAPLLLKGKGSDKDALKKAHEAVVDGAYEVIRLKGYTSWAIGYSAAGLVSSILRNQRRVHPVSIMAQGFHGIKQEVYISLPAMLGRLGVHSVVNSQLDNEELSQLHESAAQIWDIQSKLKL